MLASQNATYIDARESVINTVKGDQQNYYGNSLDQVLQKLEPARMDASNRSMCLEGTRTQLTQSITDWASRPLLDQRILWLHGFVGSGKSTISTTVANFFDERRCLGAFVFFDRGVDERRQPSSVIRTIAHQLGMFDPRIGTAIAKTINTTSNITQLTLVRQFTDLIIRPLLTIPTPKTPIVIVLDALDECGNANGREVLLATLVAKSIELPSVVRIIITSRKEPDITTAFMDKLHIHVQELDLSSTDNKEDIISFLRDQMSKIRAQNPGLSLAPHWPGDDKIHDLAVHAAGLFVWASTACLFIREGHDPPKRLDQLLQGDINTNAQSALDALYAIALKSAASWGDDDFLSDFRAIVGTIIVAKNPLSDEAIDTLLRLKRPSRHVIFKLGCVLQWAEKKPIRILHPSFADFLSNRPKDDAFYIDTQLCNQRLAFHSVNHLNDVLRRNICDLTLSPTPVTAQLPEGIIYASTSWIDHVIKMTEVPESFAATLEQFLFRNLLHWLEVMSIARKSWEAIALLRSLRTWAGIHMKDLPDFCDLIYDGCRFAQIFAPLIKQHPLLIYSSALPFSPNDTTLYKNFHGGRHSPWIAGGYEKSWSPLLTVLLDEQDKAVLSVTMTPNGTHIISGSANGTIGIWDATSGDEILPRLTGHSGSVHSVACSPDGTRIASGSDDAAIRLWDLKSRTEVSVLKGHESRVTSVCFSPASSSDGISLLSGSRDCTVRLWDTSSDVHVVGRCTSWINAVAFSPDGQRFVSGAANGTVRVRETVSGAKVFLLLSNEGSIQSVAFSPDGQWIISGSTDKIIRIWNAEFGTQVFQPIESPRAIRSLAFFPNGKRIISGAENGTIRVWDFESGTEDRPPLREHIRSVGAVAASHDGRSIISGSKDKSIRIWDADYSVRALETENPGRIAITALALSHDGACFATGLQNKSIHLWNTSTGVEMSSPLEGHKGIIRSLSFSPRGGKIASGADTKEGIIRVWNTKLGCPIFPLLGRSDIGGTLSIAFSSDGHWIASGSTDSIIRIWDLDSGTEALSLRGHRGEVRCIAFSPDGTQVISGSNDHTVRVWDARSGAQISPSFNEHKSFVRSVAFSSDALQIFSQSSSQKVVHKWSPDDAIGKLTSKTDCISHPTSHVLDPFTLTSDGWIVDMSSEKRVSKLPPHFSMLSVIASAASNTSLVIATNRGAVCVMHFQKDVPLDTDTLQV